MGHVLFLLLHLIAAAFFLPGLLVTIPLHLIYSAVAARAEPKPNAWTHVRCPDCKELVQKEASACKHCGCRLVPASKQSPSSTAG